MRGDADVLRCCVDVAEGPLQRASAIVGTASRFRIDRANDRRGGVCRMRPGQDEIGPLLQGGRATRCRRVPGRDLIEYLESL